MTAIDGLPDAAIRALLTATRRVAVVGASPNPARPSHGVTAILLAHGFEVTPINPGQAGQTLLGRPCVATLAAAATLDMVDIFRAPEHVGPVVDEAVALGARSIWMQLGIVDHAAAERARRAGLIVVMDRCPAIEWPRLGLGASD